MSKGPIAGTDAWSPLFEPLAYLRANWPQRGWSWDGRMGCVSSSFSVEFEPKTRAAAKLALPQEWGMNELDTAPADVRGVVDNSGGLRPGQLIMAGPVIGGVFAFGLW